MAAWTRLVSSYFSKPAPPYLLSHTSFLPPSYHLNYEMRKAERQRVTRRTRNFTGVLTFQICQFSQTTTLTLPLSQSSRGVTMCFDASTSSVSGPTQTCFDSTSTLPPLAAPPPPQFADSPPDEVSFSHPANFSLVDLPTYPPSCLV